MLQGEGFGQRNYEGYIPQVRQDLYAEFLEFTNNRSSKRKMERLEAKQKAVIELSKLLNTLATSTQSNRRTAAGLKQSLARQVSKDYHSVETCQNSGKAASGTVVASSAVGLPCNQTSRISGRTPRLRFIDQLEVTTPKVTLSTRDRPLSHRFDHSTHTGALFMTQAPLFNPQATNPSNTNSKDNNTNQPTTLRNTLCVLQTQQTHESECTWTDSNKSVQPLNLQIMHHQNVEVCLRKEISELSSEVCRKSAQISELKDKFNLENLASGYSSLLSSASGHQLQRELEWLSRTELRELRQSVERSKNKASQTIAKQKLERAALSEKFAKQHYDSLCDQEELVCLLAKIKQRRLYNDKLVECMKRLEAGERKFSATNKYLRKGTTNNTQSQSATTPNNLGLGNSSLKYHARQHARMLTPTAIEQAQLKHYPTIFRKLRDWVFQKIGQTREDTQTLNYLADQSDQAGEQQYGRVTDIILQFYADQESVKRSLTNKFQSLSESKEQLTSTLNRLTQFQGQQIKNIIQRTRGQPVQSQEADCEPSVQNACQVESVVQAPDPLEKYYSHLKSRLDLMFDIKNRLTCIVQRFVNVYKENYKRWGDYKDPVSSEYVLCKVFATNKKQEDSLTRQSVQGLLEKHFENWKRYSLVVDWLTNFRYYSNQISLKQTGMGFRAVVAHKKASQKTSSTHRLLTDQLKQLLSSASSVYLKDMSESLQTIKSIYGLVREPPRKYKDITRYRTNIKRLNNNGNGSDVYNKHCTELPRNDRISQFSETVSVPDESPFEFLGGSSSGGAEVFSSNHQVLRSNPEEEKSKQPPELQVSQSPMKLYKMLKNRKNLTLYFD